MKLPNFVTHYFESDKGPFRNICDLSDAEIASIIALGRRSTALHEPSSIYRDG
jgi:hypothetical protein